MARPKRGRNREHALSEVSRLHLEGLPQRVIAERLGVSTTQIYYDMRVLYRRWQDRTVQEIGALKNREIERIDHIAEEAWKAWYRSQQDEEETVTERIDGPTAKAVARVRRKGMTGNAAYLGVVQWTVEQRCKILGLYAPQTMTIEHLMAVLEEYGAPDGITAEELRDEGIRLLKAGPRG